MGLTVFWFRRDLRLEDNTALNKALKSGNNVLPIFIFDFNIVDELPRNDARITFIYDSLVRINKQLNAYGSALTVLSGEPLEVWKRLLKTFEVDEVFVNKDYEPYAIKRDRIVKEWLDGKGIKMHQYKDQVIFETDEVIKSDQTPYTVFTPYKKKWLSQFNNRLLQTETVKCGFYNYTASFPSIEELGFKRSEITVRDYDLSKVDTYADERDFPAKDASSYLGPHLRFGTVSIRQIIGKIIESSEVFLSELIWREFFMQILWHFPRVVSFNFKPQYDGIKWLNNDTDFKKWSRGMTGYPLVDAGMRQLNETGYMHNRVRMVVASFLCKHLLIDWRWGEAYFAQKLLDYELSSNNGNWQWAAGTGCDAAPYFRIFNPVAQQEKFDKHMDYVKRWVPELLTDDYVGPLVDHKQARERALFTYKKGIV